MLALTHTVMGAAVGSIITGAPASFVSGVTLHLITDKIHHYFPNGMLNKRILAGVDWVVSAILLVFLYQKGFSLPVLLGGLGGLAVDVILIPIDPIRKSALGEWHVKRQHHKRNPWYLLLDLGLILFSLFIWGLF